MTKLILYSALLLSLWACGGGQQKGFSTDNEQELNTAPVKIKVPVDERDTILVIASGATMSEMRFDVKNIKVPAGKELTIALENQSTDATMPHNIVFVQEGTGNKVGQAGLAYKDNSYVQPNDKNVIAHSPLVQIGETVYFTFTTPTAGDYSFICSYPGHWGLMKGDFITE